MGGRSFPAHLFNGLGNIQSTSVFTTILGPPGYTGQTTGMDSAKTPAHPPTDTMNKVAGDKAMSSQDTQAQQQGQPTAAQQAQGAQPREVAGSGLLVTAPNLPPN